MSSVSDHNTVMSTSFELVESTANSYNNPLRSLWASVLHQAILDINLNMPKRKSCNYSTFQAAKASAIHWVFGGGNPNISNSFESVCEILDLSPSRIRTKIKAMITD